MRRRSRIGSQLAGLALHENAAAAIQRLFTILSAVVCRSRCGSQHQRFAGPTLNVRSAGPPPAYTIADIANSTNMLMGRESWSRAGANLQARPG
jgi:hypothetical protein